jgi:hypothetical protein
MKHAVIDDHGVFLLDSKILDRTYVRIYNIYVKLFLNISIYVFKSFSRLKGCHMLKFI